MDRRCETNRYRWLGVGNPNDPQISLGTTLMAYGTTGSLSKPGGWDLTSLCDPRAIVEKLIPIR